MRRLCFALFSTVAALPAALLFACGGDPPEPGFEEVGGSGEGAGDTTSAKSSGSGSSKASGSTTPQSSASSTATSSNASTSASTGSSGCNDNGPGEPNDTEATAVDMGGIGDCDDDEEGTASGVLDGATDADWYKFHGTDASSLCTTDPDREIVASHPIRICKFVQCDDNEANDFECPSGTMNAASPDGRPGCCSSSGFEFSITCGSSSIDSDNAMVYIRIDTTENQCVSYDLTWHY